MDGEMVPVSIKFNLPEEEYRKFKAILATEGKIVTAWTMSKIREELRKHQGQEKTA